MKLLGTVKKIHFQADCEGFQQVIRSNNAFINSMKPAIWNRKKQKKNLV